MWMLVHILFLLYVCFFKWNYDQWGHSRVLFLCVLHCTQYNFVLDIINQGLYNYANHVFELFTVGLKIKKKYTKCKDGWKS